MAEMELCSRPFEPDLDDTSGGKWNEPFMSASFILTLIFKPLISLKSEWFFILQIRGMKNESDI
ncbi:hypothetical protein J2S10_001011 [Neobacillus ginsengisoli]|uniref:Uncharacterized protein n=1 Tax=Neobacillus ginsengisoli TaxID=904295 RepID=A0ABT9XQY2_9BACI|nr:hypothetical protein [Neobacillus ginsengisoli]